jgi:hypothetical protein
VKERRFCLVEGETDGGVVELFDALDQVLEAHRFKIREARGRLRMPGVLGVELALEAPEYVIGVQVAAGFEVVGAVEFHPLAQVKSVLGAVGADVPALGQARGDVGGARDEVDQAVEECLG